MVPPPASRNGDAAQAKPEDQDYAIVPIFYGTDRNRVTTPKRIDYGSDRARRLELGFAEVTIPKKHQVPNIERPWALKVPYLEITLWQAAENPRDHFTVKSVQARSEEEFLAAVKARLGASKRYPGHALVFVHGYNNGFDVALYRTAQIAYDIDFDGAPMLYSWPSGGNFTSYNYDRESSVQAEPYMRKFFEMVTAKTGATAIDVVAHSMGNVPLLNVLRDLRRSLPTGVALNQIVLAAPDVDRDIFTNLANEIKGIAKGVTLYASSNDNALIISRQVAGGVPRAGEVPAEGPLVLDGIDTIDVSAASTDVLAVKHNTYAERKELLTDIGALFRTGVRPPKARFPLYETVTTPAGGSYWRFPVRP